MSTQIFKKNIPNAEFFQFLEKVCVKTEKCYVYNLSAFKRGVYTEDIPRFLESIKEYYHLSKRKYLERKLDYNSFTTVLRQICKFNKITFTSQIKYEKSGYEIIYYFYFN